MAKRSGILIVLFCAGQLIADTIWQSEFSAMKSLPGYAKVMTNSGSGVLEIYGESQGKNALMNFPLESSKIAGHRIVLSAEIEMDIKRSPGPGNGAKMMISGRTGKEFFYSTSPLPSGKNGWEKYRFVIDVPLNLENAGLFLGLQKAKGTIRYKNVKIERGDWVLNLAPFVNMGYQDKVAGDKAGGWTDQGPEKDASKFIYKGKKEWAGIPFSVLDPARNKGKSVVVFHSPYFQQGVKSVELDLSKAEIDGKYLYLLHTLAYGRGTMTFGTIEITGKNGKTQQLVLKANREASDWRNPQKLPNGYVASIWTTPALGICGLYQSEFPLDGSLGQLEKIKFSSSGENPIWLLLAAIISNRKYEHPKEQQFVTQAGKEWKPLPIRKQGIRAGSALDRSFLNPPQKAGAFGRVVIDKTGHLEFEKRPGEPVRFFASADGLDTFCGRGPVPKEVGTKEQIREYAEQLRLHGYNMVRLHGVDLPLVQNLAKDEQYNKDFLDRLDYFIYCLKENGIYLNLDGMKSSIGYTPGNPYDPKEKRNYKYDIYFNPAVRENWKWGMNLVMTHKNPYTGTRLADDPVLAVIVGYNEQEFALMRDRDFSAAKPVWNAFLKRKYGTLGALRQVWKNEKENWRTFEDIPVFRLSDLNSGHGRDVAEFLTETEREITRWYRGELNKMGYKGLVSNFNMSKMFRSIFARSESDLVTMNSYHAHPSHYNQPGSSIMQNSSISNAGNQARAFFSVSAYGKPFMITEQGHAFWNRYRYEQAFITGAYSAFQDLDGITAFAQPVSTHKTSFINPFNIRFDPIGCAQEFLTAFLFLRRDVRAAEHICRIPISEKEIYAEGLFNESLSTRQSRLALVTGFRLDVDSGLPLQKNESQIPRSGSSGMFLGGAFANITESGKGTFDLENTIQALKKSGILNAKNKTDPDKEIYESSTGELYLDAAKNFMSIITPRFEGICGEAGTQTKLSSLEILSMSVRGNLALVSIDGLKPLSESARMVLVFATDARNSGMTFSDPDRRTLVKNGTAPILVKTGSFKVRIPDGASSSVKVYALRDDGSRLCEVPIKKTNTWFELEVDTASFGPEIPIYFEIIKQK